VVDFIEVHIFAYHWPDFNLADSAIVIGACLLLLDSLLTKSNQPE
jgi:signal peptidase II